MFEKALFRIHLIYSNLLSTLDLCQSYTRMKSLDTPLETPSNNSSLNICYVPDQKKTIPLLCFSLFFATKTVFCEKASWHRDEQRYLLRTVEGARFPLIVSVVQLESNIINQRENLNSEVIVGGGWVCGVGVDRVDCFCNLTRLIKCIVQNLVWNTVLR